MPKPKDAKNLLEMLYGAPKPAVSRLDMNFKDVTKRMPELQQAAKLYEQGKITREQYYAIVDQLKPVTPYEFIPKPATAEEALAALTSDKTKSFGRTDVLTPGETILSRLDIPAYSKKGTWVTSQHRLKPPADEPKTIYTPTMMLEGETKMLPGTKAARKVAKGEDDKSSFATIRGAYKPGSDEEAVERAMEALRSKDYAQIGYDPERRGFFYDRRTMEPIIGTEEGIIQIGPLVLGKKPVRGNPEDFEYKEGGAVNMQDGGDPTQMFNFNPMAAKAAKQKQMRESTPETPLGALSRGFASGLFGNIEDPVPYTGSIMEGSPQRQQSQANLREIGRNVGALTDIGGMVTPFVKPATQAITRGATALGRTGLEQVDRAMFGEGPLASLVAPVAPLQAVPRVQAPVSRLGFYDPVEQAGLNIQRKQGPGQAFLNELQRSENVSKDFLEASGIAEKLRTAPNITRDEVQAMTKGAVPEVQEIVLGSNVVPPSVTEFAKVHLPNFNPSNKDSIAKLIQVADQRYQKAMADGDLDIAEFAEQAETEAKKLASQYESGSKPADRLSKYAEYQLPGGKNYREVLLTVPVQEPKAQFYARKQADGTYEVIEKNGQAPILIDLPDYETAKREIANMFGPGKLQSESVFRGQHWQDPNVVSHIRMNDRTDFNGKKVLFIEEMQSDWAQQGRKKGFGQEVPEGPFVKNTNEWVDLSLKSILKRAVDEGYDRVAFINGKQSADRYDLANYVDNIHWDSNPQSIMPKEAEKVASLFMKDYGVIELPISSKGIIVSAKDRQFNGKRLDEVVGRDVANKIMAGESGSLEGEGLSIGGEGMKKFYDQIVPDRLRKLVGKDKVKHIPGAVRDDVPQPLIDYNARRDRYEVFDARTGDRMGWFDTASDAKDFVAKIESVPVPPQLGFDITPEIREKFSKPIPYKEGGAVKRVHISDNPDTMLLELAMGGPVRMAGGKAVSDVAEFAGKKFLPKAAAASADISKLGDTALGQAVKEGRRQRESVTLSGALAPLQAPVRGETSKELLKAQTKQLTDQEKETLDGLRQTYPDFSNAVKFMTPQEVSKIIRNPEGVKEMDRLLQTIPSAKELAAVAKAGTPKQGWYRASTQALIDVFGVQDAPRFASLLAAMSPQTSVESNLINALNTWKNWTSAGRPTDPKQIKAIMGQSVQGSGTEASVLDAWTNNAMRALRAPNPLDVVLSGPKVDSFYRNLADDVYRVTNDAWMASGLGVDQGKFSGSPTALQLSRGDPGLSPGYIASSARMREAGQLNKMLPSEAQETTWSYFMPLYEMQRKTGLPAREILQRGLLTPESIRGTPDFSTLLTQGQYGDVLRQAGYGEQLSAMKPYQFPESAPSLSLSEQREVERAARRLESLKGLRESESRSKIFELPKTRTLPSGEVREIMPESGFASAQIEYIPGEGTGILPDMITASPGAKQYFSSRMAGAFRDPQERDILQRSLGLEPLQTRSMTGSFRPSGEIGFQGNVREQAYGVPKARETNPGYASLVEVPLTKRGDIPKEYKEKLGAAEALRGYMTGQQGSTYNLQVPTLKGESAMVKLEKKADPENIRYASAMTDDDVFLADTGRGVAAIFNPYKPGNLPLGERGRRDIADYLGSQDAVPTRNISDYIDYSEALTGPQGTGAATKILQERLSPLDAASQKRLSEAAQPIAGDVLELMTKQHERANIPMRPDYARALELIKRGGIPALMAALAAGEALPAEMVSELLSEAR